jgi:hypothetical protein
MAVTAICHAVTPPLPHAGEGRGEGLRHQRSHSQPSPSRRVASGPSLSRMRERGCVHAFGVIDA